jgi:hypothetical protein
VGFALDMYTTIGFVRETFGENTGPVIGWHWPTPETAGRKRPISPAPIPMACVEWALTTSLS